tara:strand:- start:305 stop:553 length:249 start_codon:yes stop_codon:yes gene_type:complete
MSSTDKAKTITLTNDDLKKVVIDLGVDIVDTLDSIHNALVNQRKVLKKLHDKVDSLKCNTDVKIDLQNQLDDMADAYSHYIG